MSLARLKDWAYPAEIKDVKDVDTYLRRHYEQHVEESASRIEDFENLEIDASSIGTLALASGSITDSSGAISFGNENLSTTGTLGSGELTVDSGAGCSIIIKGTSTGNANLGWIGFYDSNGTTRRGYVGDGNSGNDDIYLGADTGYLRLLAAGYISLGTHTYFPDDVVMSFGASLDYSIGFAVATDTLQIVDGTTLGSNVRLELDSSGHFDFGAGNLTTTGNQGIGVSAWGTSAAKVLGIGGSTAPTTSPADMIQLWSEDRSATHAQLYYRAESGIARALDSTHNVADYGASGSESAANNSTYIQAAIDAAGEGGAVTLIGNTSYSIDTALTLNYDKISFCAVGGVATLSISTDIEGLVLSKTKIVVKDIYVTNSGASTKAGVKLDDGSRQCYLLNVHSGGFEYNLELVSSGTATGVYYNLIENFHSTSAEKYDIYMHDNSGSVNENLFLGGDLHGTSTSECVYMEGNQNKFMGTSFENWKQYGFAVIDMGRNFIEGCRFEYDSGRKPSYGIYAENSSGNFANSSRYINNWWGCSEPYIALYAGRVRVQDDVFMGGILVSGDRVATAVDITSASGQKVLSVASTTDMYVGDVLLVDDEEDGGGKEWVVIASIAAGVSITAINNLIYEHTSGDADTVVCKERKCGMDIYGVSAKLDFYAYGERGIQLDQNGVFEAQSYGQTLNSNTARVILRSNTSSATGYLDFNANNNAIVIPETNGYFDITEYSSNDNLLRVLATGGILMPGLKSGTDQTDAGASENELYVDSNDDNTIKLGAST